MRAIKMPNEFVVNTGRCAGMRNNGSENKRMGSAASSILETGAVGKKQVPN